MQARMQTAAAEAAGRAAMDSANDSIRGRFTKLRYLSAVRTVVGCITVFGVWSAALASLLSVCILVGVYLLIIAIPITLLELFFFFRTLTFFVAETGRVGRLKGYLAVLDSWKRGVLYALLGIIGLALSMPFGCFWALLAVICLLTLSCLYCAKSFQAEEIAEDRQPAYEAPAGAKMEDAAAYNQVP